MKNTRSEVLQGAIRGLVVGIVVASGIEIGTLFCMVLTRQMAPTMTAHFWQAVMFREVLCSLVGVLTGAIYAYKQSASHDD